MVSGGIQGGSRVEGVPAGGGPAEGPAKIKAGGRVGAEGITLKVSLFSTVLIPACSLQLG